MSRETSIRTRVLEALDDPAFSKILDDRADRAFWFAFLNHGDYRDFAKRLYLCGMLDGAQAAEAAR